MVWSEMEQWEIKASFRKRHFGETAPWMIRSDRHSFWNSLSNALKVMFAFISQAFKWWNVCLKAIRLVAGLTLLSLELQNGMRWNFAIWYANNACWTQTHRPNSERMNRKTEKKVGVEMRDTWANRFRSSKPRRVCVCIERRRENEGKRKPIMRRKPVLSENYNTHRSETIPQSIILAL